MNLDVDSLVTVLGMCRSSSFVKFMYCIGTQAVFSNSRIDKADLNRDDT